MAKETCEVTRRAVLRAGIGLLASGTVGWPTSAASEPIATRPFGRGGKRVPILGLGGYFDPSAGRTLLPIAHALGVRLWEATLSKGAKAHGEFFGLHPELRDQVFFVGKTATTDPAGMSRDLARVLADARTDHLDLFVVQGLDDPTRLDESVRVWAASQRAEGRIRAFGFSTHANVVACLRRASALPWIDGVMAVYNYRLLGDPEVEEVIEACTDTGIGLIAIKSQALPLNPDAEIGVETEAARRRLAVLTEPDAGEVERGHAKLRAVWSNPRIASVLSMMGSPELLRANASAAQAWGSRDG